MKIGERGQVTIPKDLRERFAMGPQTEVEFVVERGELVLRKRVRETGTKRARIESCIGVLKGEPANVDEFMEEIRGR